ncbi:Uncharacterized protein OBRU01_17435, partial [Operophtera brumata]
VDMVKEINYIGIKHPELPPYFGQIDGLEKFDAQFFRVTKGQATSFDPLARKIMEESYSAIFDAGINPETLKGLKLGVFVGSSLSDSTTINLYEVFKLNGFVISGKTMIANRVSYWIDGKGPSYCLDYACASSMACLEIAYQRLKAGDCDTALVGGCIHSMNPVLTLNMKRAGLLCADGKTKCFDKNGDGFVRSDAINMLFLQKAKDAKRTFRCVNRRTEYKITGISEADGNELDAVGRFFGEGKPIKVGSIKSNMGHTQPVSGACSLTKIGLTDVLKSMDLFPDKIIGHSLGEIACAYADCCLTTEEAILVSYFRGITSIETKLIKGKMAAIGLGHKKVRDLCPPEIDIACRNSCESTTISGPAQDIDKFVAYLTSRSIFTKAVASNNIAFHSRYMADAGMFFLFCILLFFKNKIFSKINHKLCKQFISGPILLAKMKEFLKDPKTRSKKWLSTCFLPENWTNAICQYASPEYFTHNILNTVYFEETAKFIPVDAIVIEIAPHGLMQAIIKRSHVNCIHVPLTRRDEKDNVLFMLKAIGTLYQAGLNPDVDAIYPVVDFPVSTETPVLSHFVEWDHSEEW